MSIVSSISFSLNITRVPFVHWGGIMILGTRPDNIVENIIGAVGHLLFAGVLGIGLAFILGNEVVTSRVYLLKGLLYSGFVWFGIYAITIAFKVPNLTTVTSATALSNFVGSAIYGLVAAEVLRRLDQRLKT